MQTMDARGILAQALMRGRHGAKKTGKTIAFRCPRHADGTASAWLGDHAWGCSACGFNEGLHTLAEVLGVTLPASGSRGLTVAEYAERKGLSQSLLSRAGIEDRVGKYGDAVVAIPYRNAAGEVIRTKLRGPKGTWWDRDGVGAPLYGQDVLATTPITVPVLIVEGESDCHAGWQRGLCVVGLPGASQWRSEYAPLLANRTVYVWQEPDEGGATLVASVAKDLPKALVVRDVKHNGDVVKDLCDLHQRFAASETAAFMQAWRTIIDTATPIGAEAPAMAFDSITGETLEHILEEKLAPIDAVPTMLPKWNGLCHGGGGAVGIARGWFITIGANTGNGKSLVALNLGAEAVKHGEIVTFVSLEMSRSELATRYLSILTGEPVLELEQGQRFVRETFERASRKANEVREQSGGHLLVNRRPLSKLADVVSSIRYHAETHGSRFFCVDYLQLASTVGGDSINDRIERVAHQLRDIAQSLHVTLIALSQFNRSTSAARSERPVSQGLMGGSAIENDSAQVLLLDHSRFTRTGETADTWLILDKNRHGGVGDIPVRWDYRTLRLLPRTATIEEQESEHGKLSKFGRLRT